jgi:hypothetical protein
MATLEDAARLALALPEVVEGERYGRRTWFVGKKGFAWERPLSKADIKRLDGATPPDGPLLGVLTADLGEKEAILAAGTKGVFAIQHFDNYPAYLIQLKAVSKKALKAATAL